MKRPLLDEECERKSISPPHEIGTAPEPRSTRTHWSGAVSSSCADESTHPQCEWSADCLPRSASRELRWCESFLRSSPACPDQCGHPRYADRHPPPDPEAIQA